jgi:hypothetical protein
LVLLLAALCFSFAAFQQKQSRPADAKFWVGVTYAMSKQHKYSDETIAGIGVFGVAHAAMEGAIWGTVGGPAGIVAGAAAGL